MATVQIRNLNDEAYGVLRTRAAASGRSLQEYLRMMLEEQAARRTNSEILAEARADLAASPNDVTADDIVAIIRAGRDR